MGRAPKPQPTSQSAGSRRPRKTSRAAPSELMSRTLQDNSSSSSRKLEINGITFPATHLIKKSPAATILSIKSNYECVVEGMHTELGLCFPDAMVNSIKSRRTKHGAAEQARRDRMNAALAQMAKALFGEHATTTADGSAIVLVGDRRRNKAGKAIGDAGGITKVRLIETATECIRAQRAQIESMERRLERTE